MTIQGKLFDVPARPDPFPGRVCRECGHFYRHRYRPDKYKYCNAERQANTFLGHKKVGALQKACNLFIEDESYGKKQKAKN